MNRVNLRLFAALICALAIGISAKAQTADTVSAPAVQTAYIRPDGPQKGANGDRFLDVEGKDTGKYACYGIARFDAKSVKSALDAKFGAGKWRITGLSLELTQSNAGFSKDGSVQIYLSQGAAPDLGALKYPYTPKEGPLHGDLLTTVKYVKSAAPPGNVGKAGDPAAPKTDSCDILKGTAGQSLAGAISQGKTITLVLAEADPTVAATWAGLKPSGQHKPPTLIVKATSAK
jgi:hypothetical protein